MKKYKVWFLLIALLILPCKNVFADTQSFYFKDFTADYYLKKAEDGTSDLHVKEVLTAVFPDYDQNHGISRAIPYLNQNDKNRTIKDKNALNLTVLRNGEPEPINKIEEESGYYMVYIGSASSYVRGEQVYTLEYDFKNVITEFDENGNNISGSGVLAAFQELYWDTNGTGWSQKFDKLTARVHVAEDALESLEKQAWCYVGKYGLNTGKCEIEKTSDGFKFTTGQLVAGENLTFAIQFKPPVFKVTKETSYILVIILAVEVLIILILTLKIVRKWKKEARDNYRLYKTTFVAPEYQPPKDKTIHVAEAEQVSIKPTKTSYVASLLELVVSHAVSISREKSTKRWGKDKWKVHIETDPEKLSKPQLMMLQILAGKGSIAKDDEITIENHKATKQLADYAETYEKSAKDTLKERGYFKETRVAKKTDSFSNVFSLVFLKLVTLFVIFSVGLSVFSDVLEIGSYVELVGGDYLPFLIGALILIYLIFGTYFKQKIEKYSKYEKEGIKLARYLDGLKLYIKMAEADRIKFLQSVEGADTSDKGIVKLYEKLLPWACLFGEEESWMKELAEYYKIEDVPEAISPDLLNGIMASNLLSSINKTIQTSSTYVPPSSHSSSGFSGGGGGGFSGGGGGGGGGGGW